MANLNSQIKEMVSSLLFHREKFDILDISLIRKLVLHRAFQYAVMIPNLLIFWVVILAGFFGSVVGNMNLSIVFVWMLWWFALIAVMLPYASRIWCLICPIPGFGEWLQRRSMVRKFPGFKWLGQNKSWPTPIKNIWLQNFGFLIIATFSALMVTRPIVTGILLASLFIIATILAVVYAKRAFCRFICPVAGFLGLYSMFAALEIRSKDKDLCSKHLTKECVKGSDTSYGCPWMLYPGGFDRNNFCGLCMECVKACPYKNMGVSIRGFGKDILVKTGRALDEAWKAFIMLSLSVLYIVVTYGPWGFIRDWANVLFTPPYGFALTGLWGFALFTVIFWGVSLVVTPAIFFAFTAASKALTGSKESLKKLVIDFSYELIPIGLSGWIGFSIPIIIVSWAYILNVVSDPFGWGWNLIGTRDVAWQPAFPQIIPLLQVLTLIIGVFYSVRYGFALSKQNFPEKNQALRAFIPQLIFILGVALLLTYLFIG